MFQQRPLGAPIAPPVGGLLDPRVLRARKVIAKVPAKKKDKYKNPPRG